MSSLVKLPKTASESSEPSNARRRSAKRILSPVDDDAVTAVPPHKKPRVQRSSDGSNEDVDLDSPVETRQASNIISSRSKPRPASKKKRSKVVLSDPESEEFNPMDDDSTLESQMPVDDDEYLSEPKHPAKRAAGGKGKLAKGSKVEPQDTPAKDERKRPIESTDPTTASVTKRPRTKPSLKMEDIAVDVTGDATPGIPSGQPTIEESVPHPLKKQKLPAIKKNKAPAGPMAGTASGSTSAGTPTPSTSRKPATPIAASIRTEPDSKLPPPVVGARKPTVVASTDVDLSNPMMYAQLFKSGGGSTPSGFSRREKDEERRKGLNRLRDEARVKRINEAAPAFDLQGQMDKITRFEERLRAARSAAVYPNFLAGALKQVQLGKTLKCYGGDTETREEGEM
ncbi:hypothetical protein B0H10DRAFT_2207833 [Mycena sp. CBHHK59/15]|nr:hypothetical protein B0H10DRAFT_2207833 [Mycena sp. CBHHK59/15]